jgi:hypothetical protein
VDKRQGSRGNGEGDHAVGEDPRQSGSGQRLSQAESLLVALPVAVAPVRHEGTEPDERQRHNQLRASNADLDELSDGKSSRDQRERRTTPADELVAELRAALPPRWADKAEEIWRAHAGSV